MEEKIDGVTIHYMAKFDKAGKMTHVSDYKFKKEGFMNKFIYKNASDITSHWELCNQNKYPFITINNIDRNFNEIFFESFRKIKRIRKTNRIGNKFNWLSSSF